MNGEIRTNMTNEIILWIFIIILVVAIYFMVIKPMRQKENSTVFRMDIGKGPSIILWIIIIIFIIIMGSYIVEAISLSIGS